MDSWTAKTYIRSLQSSLNLHPLSNLKTDSKSLHLLSSSNSSHNSTIPRQPFNLPALLILILFGILMAFQTPAFLSRLFRPFTTSISRPLAPDSLATSTTLPSTAERAIFAGGCFWGLEDLYRRDFASRGLLDCRVGYTGGSSAAPDYRSVCSGRTGHAESLLLAYDPAQLTYSTLCEYFFKMHDPTTLNRQGADTGSQYRSAIFYENEKQREIAEKIKSKVEKEWYKGQSVVTEIKPATQWYDAEDYHQDYLTKTPYGYHCPAHYVRKFPPLSED